MWGFTELAQHVLRDLLLPLAYIQVGFLLFAVPLPHPTFAQVKDSFGFLLNTAVKERLPLNGLLQARALIF
jgi:hypothetical protein